MNDSFIAPSLLEDVNTIHPAEISRTLNRHRESMAIKTAGVRPTSAPSDWFGIYKNDLRKGVTPDSRQVDGASLRTGVMVLSSDRRVIVQTPPARLLIADYFPDSLNGKRLPALLEDWVSASGQEANSEITIEGTGRLLSISLVTEQSLSVLMLTEQRKPVTSDSFRALGLTVREAEVMHLVSQGKTNWEIAQILEMGQRTVDKHMEHILEKLGAENRTTALRIAMERCAL